jgi:hypothetical protein
MDGRMDGWMNQKRWSRYLASELISPQKYDSYLWCEIISVCRKNKYKKVNTTITIVDTKFTNVSRI